MHLHKDGGILYLDGRELSDLDLFVCRVLRVLSAFFSYVIVSGYVAILLGRTRSTEDVDILIPPGDQPICAAFHEACIQHGYEFLNAGNVADLYSLLVSGSGIRLCEQDLFIPNIEIKFIKDEVDAYSFEQRMQLVAGGETFFISPLEIQIAYKLWLGSQKDIEDAIFIREVAGDIIDEDQLCMFCESFGVDDETT
ncbi:MAG: hypothetical protein ACP5C4_05885 [Methanomicrobiales archaeon]